MRQGLQHRPSGRPIRSPARRFLQLRHHARDAVCQLFVAQFFAQPLHQQRKGKRRWARQVLHHQRLAGHARQARAQAGGVKFQLQQLRLGLVQQPVARVVLLEHLPEKR